MAKSINLPATFHALGDNTRFKLFELLGKKPEICVGDLAGKMGISSACVSQHMKILSDVGLVERVRDGQRVCYKISIDNSTKKTLHNLIFNKG